jgi:hypothetical protein
MSSPGALVVMLSFHKPHPRQKEFLEETTVSKRNWQEVLLPSQVRDVEGLGAQGRLTDRVCLERYERVRLMQQDRGS